MKSLLLLLLISIGVGFTQAQSIKLPNECRKILKENFKGWEIAQLSRKISDYHKEKRLPFETNLVKGDWNGDGKIDYAILIEHRKKLKQSRLFDRKPNINIIF